LLTSALAAAPVGEAQPTPTLLEIGSDSSCPAPELVDAKLRDILGVPAGQRVEEVARLAHGEKTLLVSLTSRDGRPLGERALPLEGSCDELGRAAAVVLAAWLTDAHPEFVPPERATGDAQATGSSATTTAAPPVAVSTPTPPPPKGTVRSRGALVPRTRLRVRVGAAVGAGVLPTPVAVAGSALVALVPEGSGVGATLRASVATSRSLDVDSGEVRYLRWPLGAGAVLRLAGKSVSAELEAGAAVAWLHVEGRSFGTNHEASDATFGPFGTARAIATHGRVRPFLEVMGVGWVRGARVYGDPSHPSVALPSFDLTAFLGASLLL
jgi:hypothetical protein